MMGSYGFCSTCGAMLDSTVTHVCPPNVRLSPIIGYPIIANAIEEAYKRTVAEQSERILELEHVSEWQKKEIAEWKAIDEQNRAMIIAARDSLEAARAYREALEKIVQYSEESPHAFEKAHAMRRSYEVARDVLAWFDGEEKE